MTSSMRHATEREPTQPGTPGSAVVQGHGSAGPVVSAPLLLFYCQRVSLDRKFKQLERSEQAVA